MEVLFKSLNRWDISWASWNVLKPWKFVLTQTRITTTVKSCKLICCLSQDFHPSATSCSSNFAVTQRFQPLSKLLNTSEPFARNLVCVWSFCPYAVVCSRTNIVFAHKPISFGIWTIAPMNKLMNSLPLTEVLLILYVYFSVDVGASNSTWNKKLQKFSITALLV